MDLKRQHHPCQPGFLSPSPGRVWGRERTEVLLAPPLPWANPWLLLLLGYQAFGTPLSLSFGRVGWAGVGCGFLCWLFVPGPECPPPAWASCRVLFPRAPPPCSLLPLPPVGGGGQGLGSRLWGHLTARARLFPKACPHRHWLKEPSEVTSGFSRQCHLSLQPPEGTVGIRMGRIP